ncbi:glutamate racemase [Haliangium sp.]|uniref:glutamate racemase n=1 Tax=Haliangium sp. TaxID=2663208 RepID=UPI003D10B10E
MHLGDARIGVFDSGVGGLTVVRALRSALPGHDIIYLGDTARVPYGTKSPRTVERYSLACQRFLLDHAVDLVLVACNTASATALPALREASAVPVIGVVEPGAESALRVSRHRRIGVIGTLATVGSGAYPRAIRALAPDSVVVAEACPLLVPLAEEGWTDDDIARAVAHRYLSRLFAQDPGLDTLVLGCTHYPLLRAVLAEIAEALAGHPIAVVDSATALAVAADAHFGGSARSGRAGGGSLHCFATDTSRLEELAPRFLGERPASFALVDI